MDPVADPGYPDYGNYGYATDTLSPEEVEKTGHANARRRKIRQIVSALISAVIIIVAIAATFFTVRWLLAGKKTYSNSASDISFKYPRSLDQVTQQEFAKSSVPLIPVILTTEYVSHFNEAIFISKKDGKVNCFLGIQRVDGIPAGADRWGILTSGKIQLMNDYLAPVGGITIGNNTFEDLTLGENPAYHVSASLYENSNIVANIELLLLVNKKSAFRFFMVSDPEVDIKKTFQDIIHSMKSEGSGSSGHDYSVTPQLIK